MNWINVPQCQVFKYFVAYQNFKSNDRFLNSKHLLTLRPRAANRKLKYIEILVTNHSNITKLSQKSSKGSYSIYKNKK